MLQKNSSKKQYLMINCVHFSFMMYVVSQGLHFLSSGAKHCFQGSPQQMVFGPKFSQTRKMLSMRCRIFIQIIRFTILFCRLPFEDLISKSFQASLLQGGPLCSSNQWSKSPNCGLLVYRLWTWALQIRGDHKCLE